MAGIPPPYPMLTCEGFLLNGRCFSFRGIRRVSGSRLRELFYPECLRLDEDQRAAVEEGRKLFSQAFFVAQLRHYDIQFPGSGTATDLGDRLHDAVMQGQCDDVPESIASLESHLRQEREAEACRWEEAKRAWQEEQKDEAFRNARTATERAACDVPRFMNHYFFADGNPDPSKTPEPLRLRGFVNHHAIHAAAAKVPGLQTLSEGTGTLVISWDRRKAFGSRILDNPALKTQEKVSKATSERAVMEHRVLIAQEERGQEGWKPKTRLLKLASCAGSYIVRCRDIYGKRPPFTMDIAVPKAGRHVTAAAFDFGIMKRTMLLSLSEEALSAVLKGRELYETDKWYPPGHEKDDSDDDNDNDSEEDDVDSYSSVPHKRKATSSLPASRPAKKATTTKGNSVSHRVYFKFRGREEGEWVINFMPESGYMDFLDDEGSRFKGVIDGLPDLGKAAFSGRKVSAQPARTPKSWEAFSEAAYEKERVGRWKRRWGIRGGASGFQMISCWLLPRCGGRLGHQIFWFCLCLWTGMYGAFGLATSDDDFLLIICFRQRSQATE